MSLAELVGAPVPISVAGEQLQLPVLTLYEAALAEAPYIASLKRAARFEALGLGPEAAEDALCEVAEKSIALAESSVPVLTWITNNLEGTLFALHCCLESKYPGRFTIREVAAWYHRRPKGDDDPVFKWLVGSKLIKNPTTRSSSDVKDGPQQEKTAASETSASPT